MTYNVGSNSSVRIILNNYSMTNRSQHPMHLHGHDYWIVAEGVGQWDGVANLKNPMRRDTHVLQPGNPKIGPGYMVMDFVTDNPGVWPLHCHLAWHVSAGLYVNILVSSVLLVEVEPPRTNANLIFNLSRNALMRLRNSPSLTRRLKIAASGLPTRNHWTR